MQIEDYKNLRKNFHKITEEVLGKHWYSMYYNMQDVDNDVSKHIIDKIKELKLEYKFLKCVNIIEFILFILLILVLK